MEPTITAADVRQGDTVRVRADLGVGSQAAIALLVDEVVEIGDDSVLLIGRKLRTDRPGDFAGATCRLVYLPTQVGLLARPSA